MSAPCLTNNIKISWNAWNGDDSLELSFPEQWKVTVNTITDSIKAKNNTINEAFLNPFDTDLLRNLAKDRKKIAVAVEDITRPTILEPVLKQISMELKKAGVKNEQVKFIVCCGAHAPMNRSELQKKIGKEILHDYVVYNHNAYDNLSETGIILGKTPVKLNSHFFEADCKILVGSIIPHSFAGFSSGGKLILPGLSDIATLERTHKSVMMGFKGGINDVETNKFRREIEDVAKRTGVDFFCGVVPNSSRNIAGVFTGDVVKAHRQGVAFARKIYETKVDKPADVVVLNAYPKDTELLQADAAMTPLKTSKNSIVKADGIIIIISKCSNGYGYHSLFGPGMRLSRKPAKKGMLRGRDFILFSPQVNMEEFQSLYWDGYRFIDNWQQVISILKKRYPEKCHVGIFPCAPLQLVEEIDADS